MTVTETSQGITEPRIGMVDAVVVGAGFGGMYMLYKLRQLGFSAISIEAADGVGGTWYWNRYPGCRCDVDSINYSYSFDPELEQEWTWSERYATQPEILAYANHVADRYDLRRDIRFCTRVDSARYDDAARRWRVRTDQGDDLSAEHFIMAVGCLSTSKMPEIPGIDRFQGDWYHTGRWPHEGVDFTGKRVAVIGTGSSGIQSIPIIAEQADHLTVFQRTPNFSLPAKNAPIDPDFYAQVKARYREHREEAKHSLFGVPNPPPEKSALADPPELREKVYEDGYEAGSLVGMLLAYDDLLTNKEANDTAAEYVRRRIREIVKDPEVAEALCPKDHPLGTKRPCLDTNYYATYNRPNVKLVDLRTTPLQEITERGVRTSDQEYEVDAIVYATGFDAMTGSLTAFEIRGAGGVALSDTWAAGPRTYLGVSTAGFPNFWMITGPGSPSVLSNMMVSIEQHVDWIGDAMAWARERGVQLDPTPEAEEAWTRHVDEAGQATLYPMANSWYMGANVEGKPRVFMPYIGGVGVYRQECDEVAAKGYEGFAQR